MRGQFDHSRQETPTAIRLVRRNGPVLLFLVLAVAGMLLAYWQFAPPPDSAEAFAYDPESP
ncbi:MAG: hypothetical protein R3300_16605, partial [Candidatus Promineifilaceae bacterium]|nr:hypothetical protein [Candidatus Promineifilaceae bacterium]